MPAISARTAPAEITLISAALAAVASDVTMAASSKAKARLIAFLPFYSAAMATLAIGLGQFKGAGASHKRLPAGSPCYSGALLEPGRTKHETCKPYEACKRHCGSRRKPRGARGHGAGRRRQGRVSGGLRQRRGLHDARPP